MNNWITESMMEGRQGSISMQHVWIREERNKPQESILLLLQEWSLNEELGAPLMHERSPVHFSMHFLQLGACMCASSETT